MNCHPEQSGLLREAKQPTQSKDPLRVYAKIGVWKGLPWACRRNLCAAASSTADPGEIGKGKHRKTAV